MLSCLVYRPFCSGVTLSFVLLFIIQWHFIHFLFKHRSFIACRPGFTKEVNISLAKPPLNFYDDIAKRRCKIIYMWSQKPVDKREAQQGLLYW